MSQCCAWRADLRAEKVLITAPPEGEGDTITFRVRWHNDGPDRAVDVPIWDEMNAPAVLGLSAASPVVLAYYNASGAPSVTLGDLQRDNPYVVPRIEAGGYVEAVITGVTQSATAGRILENTAGVDIPPGHEDPDHTNNTDSVTIIVPFRKVDLRVDKAMTSPAPEEDGDAVVWRVRWHNDGPNVALGVRIRDEVNLPQVLGLLPSTPVPLTYAGGATGPAATTYGALSSNAGVTVTSIPPGGYVEGTITSVVQEGYAGAVVTNSATAIPAPGYLDVEPYNNTDETSFLLPPCCGSPLQGYVGNAGAASSGGLCVALTVSGYDSRGIAMWQGRNNTWVYGSGSGNSGASNPFGYLQQTFTNPWLEPALLSVDLICQDNFAAFTAAGAYLNGKTLTFIHAITPTLGVTPPSFGVDNMPVPLNWCYNQISSNNKFFQPDPTMGYPERGFSPQTNSCRYTEFLAPGQSRTLYFQFWCVIDSSQAANVSRWVVHGGQATVSRLERGFAPM